MSYIFLNVKKINSKLILKLILLLFLFSLLFFSNSNIVAISGAIELFLYKVFPSLFPFFIATDLLSHTDFINILNNILSPIIKPLFNVSGKGAFPFIMGIISGYPTGAKILSDFRKNNICSKIECERLLAYTNNSGPLFIIGTVGTSLFLSKEIGYLLLITHLLGTLTVGILFRFYKNNDYREAECTEDLSFSNLSSVLSYSILNSLKTLGTILGYIIIFSIIINILITSGILNIFGNFENSIWIKGTILGIFEITNGINFISNIAIKSLAPNIILTSFLLGFGGISVLMQVYSIIAKTDLSIKPYIVGKILHGIFSALYTFIFIYFFPIFNFTI